MYTKRVNENVICVSSSSFRGEAVAAPRRSRVLLPEHLALPQGALRPWTHCLMFPWVPVTFTPRVLFLA